MDYMERQNAFVENVIIRQKVQDVELLAQLAEEAAELAQAALKLRRAFNGMTPVSVPDALDNLYEEVADVWLCFDVFANHGESQMRPIIENIESTKKRKRKRWLERLNNLEHIQYMKNNMSAEELRAKLDAMEERSNEVHERKDPEN